MSLSQAGEDESRSSTDTVCSIDDLLRKILVGLPLSSLHMCKSVCKRWFSLITDPTFCPNKTDHPCGLFLQLQSPSAEFAYVPLFRHPPLIKTTIFPFHHPKKPQHIEVWQSCNGLLLCYDHPDKLYVYNPTINQFKLLPLHHVWKPYNIFDNSMALAFDPALSHHYKLLYHVRKDDDVTHVYVEIYSSETCTWRAYDKTFSSVSFVAFDHSAVYWRGAIHWLSHRAVYHFSLEDIDNPHFIQVENHKTMHAYGGYDKLLVSRDCLLLVMMLQPLMVDVYEVENDCYSGWCLKYYVDLEFVGNFPGPEVDVLAIVLGDREEDSFLVLEVPGIMLVKYNIMSKTFYQLCNLIRIQILPTKFCSFLFTPSLVGV
ncbi:putative F-box domain-containing protein [Helianthus annuus]|nr:putative F-box domain-containing protein [Helianthus annuus]